jgi:hypothetical protein
MSNHADVQNKRRWVRLPRPYRVQARELVFPIAKDPLIDGTCNDISKAACASKRPLLLPSARGCM